MGFIAAWFAKIAWGSVGKWIITNLKWLGLAASVLFVVLYVRGAEKAKDQRDSLKKEVKTLKVEIKERDREYQEAVAGYEQNKNELNECLAINAKNAIAKHDIEQQMEKAVADVQELRNQTTQRVNEIRNEAKNYKQDQECRLTSDPLPVGRLRGLHD